jgi:hypothetical protein
MGAMDEDGTDPNYTLSTIMNIGPPIIIVAIIIIHVI